jgi:hypothetical protein
MPTNFDPKPPFRAPPPKEKLTTPSLSMGSIHMKPIEATNHKRYLEVEVSFPNKTLKIVVVENPTTKLASK